MSDIERGYQEVVTEYDDKYEANICKERQLPDHRDGMRMIQRRIFWVFLSMSRERRFNLTKSASIVGDTIKLHPHGDCLKGDTIVYTLDGVPKTIEDLFKSGVEFQWVLAYDIKTRKFKPVKAHSFRIGQRTKETVKIYLSDETHIECSFEHPILVKGEKWILAKDLKAGMPITGGIITDSSYPMIKSKYFDELSESLHYVVSPSSGEYDVLHHKDFNSKNNMPDNHVRLTRGEHAKLHGDYKIGLELGRKSMFSEDGKYYDAIKEKNIRLCSLASEKLGLYKAFQVLKLIKESSLDLTMENYSIFRLKTYNGPYIQSLIKRNLITNFEDLVFQFENYKGTNTDSCKGLTRSLYEPRPYIKRDTNDAVRNGVLKRFGQVLELVHLEHGKITKDLYQETRKIVNSSTKRDIFKRNSPTLETLNKMFNSFENAIKEVPADSYLSVKDIEIIRYNEDVPLYDFTVDTYENMAILTNGSDGINKTFMIVHNSSIYDSLVNEVNSVAGLLKGKGNWGDKSCSLPSKPAKMRYTECKLNKEADAFFKYTPYAEMIMGENNEPEPAFLPVPFPYALIGGFFGLSKSGRTLTPSYKMSDLHKRLVYLIKGDKSGKGPIIKPWFGINLPMKGDFEDLLTKGAGQVSIEPDLDIDEKNEKITIKAFCPDMTNVGAKLEKMSIHPKFGKYIEITDLSAKKNEIIVEYKTKYMKNVDIPFDKLCEFVKKEFTHLNTYNMMTYFDFKDYPKVSVDGWLLDNFKQILTFRQKEIEEAIKALKSKISLNEAILKIRPLIQAWLNKYKKFTHEIIEELKVEIGKLLNDKELTSKVLQISIMKLLDCEIDNETLHKEIKSLETVNTPEERQKNILAWMETL